VATGRGSGRRGAIIIGAIRGVTRAAIISRAIMGDMRDINVLQHQLQSDATFARPTR
jgi:hypothetical protein